MTEFFVPLHLPDLELPKSDRLCVSRVQDVENRASDALIDDLVALSARIFTSDSVEDQDDSLLDQDVFDFCYSLAKKVAMLSDVVQARVVQTFSGFVSNAVKRIRRSVGGGEVLVEQFQSELRAAVYLLVTVVTAVAGQHNQPEKATARKRSGNASKVAFAPQVEKALRVLTASICNEAFGLWKMALPEEEFAILYSRVCCRVMENALMLRTRTMKSALMEVMGNIVCQAPCVRITTVSTIVDLIINQEHLTNFLVDMTSQLATKYGYTPFPGDLIREIGSISSSDSSKDVGGIRNISNFLAALATHSPPLVISNLTFVLGLLDSDSYQMRNAGLSCIAQILLWSFQHQGKERDSSSAGSPRASGSTAPDGEGDENGNARSVLDNEDAEDEEDSSSFYYLSRGTRDQLLGVIQDRLHDVNSFARSHALKMWILLHSNGAVPVSVLKRVTELAIGRLQDKAALVRRNSIVLLTQMLGNNPFMGSMELQFHERKHDEIGALLKAKGEEMISLAQLEIDDPAEGGNNDTPDSSVQDRIRAVESEFEGLKRMSLYHKDALEFIYRLQAEALPVMVKLLSSKSATDTMEAMSFIQKANQVKLSGADGALKKVLPLVWRSDAAIREEVSQVFVTLFLRRNEGSEGPEASASKLLQLLDECSVAEFTSIEEILGQLQRKGEMPSAVVSALWGFVDEADYPPPVVTNALILLGMLASVDNKILLTGERLQHVHLHGFGDIACTKDPEFRIFAASCRLIRCLRLEGGSAKRYSKRSLMETLEKIATKIELFLAMKFVSSNVEDDVKRPTWFDAVQNAIDALYAICDKPEDVCADVIKYLAQQVFPEGGDSVVGNFVLSHFLFVLGHVAIRTAIQVEQTHASIKRLRANSIKQPAQDSANGDNSEDVSAMEEELGVVAEVEAEEDAFIHDLMRRDLVCRNLLGTYGPLLARLLTTDRTGTERDPLVTENCVVALTKFMAVSEEYCESQLQLLFTLLQESALPTVRANAIVALGDLAFRFPNLIEPWTSHLYSRLRDVDTGVRKNTAVVLSHLILNDMVKVKGQVSELAISLVDPSEEIKSMVKLFFFELSRKGNNPIYNMLPDTVGQLSSSELLSKEDYQSIVKFLLQFLTKDRQIESIVDKLCQRFHAAQLKQQRDLSFCLAYIQHSDKSLRFMHQQRKIFKEGLADDIVLENMKLIVVKSRRQNTTTPSTEFKEAIDQFERFLEGDGGDEANDDSDAGSVTTSKPQTPNKKAPKKKPAAKAKTPPPQRGRRPRARKL